MLFSTSTASISVAENIGVLQNEKIQLQQKITELKDNIKDIKNDIKDIKNKYPLIHLGECSNSLVLNIYSNITKSFAECNTQLTIYEGRLSSLENDQRG